MHRFALLIILLTGTLAASEFPRTTAPDGAAAYVLSPADGGTVKSPVRVVFGLRNMGVAPAGINAKGTGHPHLLIDTPLPALDRPIPADAKHLHFGGGQTETLIELEPGEHTLQLLLGDASHIPQQPPVMSKRITIIVVP